MISSVEWNIIILLHANVTVSLTLVSNKLNVPFFSVIFQWEKFRRPLWKLVSQKRAKNQEKDAGCLAVECQHHSMRSPCHFSFPSDRFSIEKVVEFLQVHPGGTDLERGYGDVRPWRPLFHASPLVRKRPISSKKSQSTRPPFEKIWKF